MQESLDESEIVAHLTTKGNDGNVYHYVASKEGSVITNKSGMAVHPSAVLHKAKGNSAAEEVHKVISAKLQAGTKKGTSDAINTLHKYSHFDWKSELTESVDILDEKTLTPNELEKREEIVKSLKKKRSDFVKRYGADRAKSVMYAVATKTAKEVTEESLDEGTDKPTEHKVGDKVWAKHPTDKSKILSGKVTRVGRTSYELLHADGSKLLYPHKEVSDNFEKIHRNPYKKNIPESQVSERIDLPQGHKYSADPITKASEDDNGHKKPQMGSKANTAATVAAILKKTKE